ncbi:hypothetical protein LR48_Vigan01g063400 [Vigna angularis]|uniref:Uncharacterized protein n=1 Tax=Phaseolus angularis TaxID=3914 RepID=A0A0L9TLP9_PHAAN|nr:hypothetical protein LR48_Vigan01g063400 [Vigna angularis]
MPTVKTAPDSSNDAWTAAKRRLDSSKSVSESGKTVPESGKQRLDSENGAWTMENDADKRCLNNDLKQK